MSVSISGKTSDTKVTLVHEPSQATITTTPPKDNQGDGTSFSPTDLMAASLASCTTTIMALYAKNHNVAIKHMDCKVDKHMQVSPRRIAKLVLSVNVKSDCDDSSWQKLVAAGRACPVRLSLHPDIVVEEQFNRV